MNKKSLVRRPFKKSNSGFGTGQRDQLYQASGLEPKSLFQQIKSSGSGISGAEAKERLSTYGLNEVEYDRSPSWIRQLIQSFVNPFIFILLAIVVISYGIDVLFAAPGDEDYKTVLVVSIMILISGLISFIQEYQNNCAAEKLKSMITTSVSVLRPGRARWKSC